MGVWETTLPTTCVMHVFFILGVSSIRNVNDASSAFSFMVPQTVNGVQMGNILAGTGTAWGAFEVAKLPLTYGANGTLLFTSI